MHLSGKQRTALDRVGAGDMGQLHHVGVHFMTNIFQLMAALLPDKGEGGTSIQIHFLLISPSPRPLFFKKRIFIPGTLATSTLSTTKPTWTGKGLPGYLLEW